MRRMERFRKTIASFVAAALLLTGNTATTLAASQEAAIPAVPVPAAIEAVGDEDLQQIEVNQGLGRHIAMGSNDETLLDNLVAGKTTAVVMKMPGSDDFTKEQAESAKAKYKLEAKAVTNGQEADNCELTANGDNFSVVQLFDKDCDIVKGWYVIAQFPQGPDKGTYNFHIKDGDKEIGRQNSVTFYDVNKLNILVVPVEAYWSAHYDGGAPSAGAFGCKDQNFTDQYGNSKPWSELCTTLKEYMLDVYPIADANFEEAQELKANTAEYDMVVGDSGGQKKLWEEACKLQSKTKDGKDRYDLILAFVMYRQDQGGGQGYTFGKPTNIITYSDKDMLPTVAHEIAHCYQVGDEYDGGSFNSNVNYPPNGYKGRNLVSGEDIASTSGAPDYWQSPKDYKNDSSVTGDKKAKVDEDGKGTMVKLSLHPYSLSKREFIRWDGVNADGTVSSDKLSPTISWMGSGYSGGNGFYWTTPLIWDHLLKELAVKTKKDTSEQQTEQSESNADVFLNAVASGAVGDSDIFNSEDDFYFDDDYRFGESRMAEVYGWLVKDGDKVKVEMNPIFSFDGDLELIEPLDKIYKDSKDIYSFVALDELGRVLRSPVDGKFAATEFYGGFFNPKMPADKRDQKEVNFNFNAEYPNDTRDFAIVKGRVTDDNTDEEGNFKGGFVWQASKDENFFADFEKKPEGYLSFADVNSQSASVEWEVYYPEGSEEPYDNKDKALYTEVYYCPEGDDGEAYYVGCSEDPDWEEGYIEFPTDSEFGTKWTRNAYVWIKVTNGVNAIDIYSDENEVTVSNSTIVLSGSGIKKKTVGDQTEYTAQCTGSAITPATTVKAMNPATGKYISLKKDVDYTVTYKDNVNVGYATVTVQGIGAYAGKNTQEFEIVKKALDGTPDEIPNVKYTADLDSAVTKYLRFKDKANKDLVFNKDFTVIFSADGVEDKSLNKVITKSPEGGNTVVTVTYSGKGNYTGKAKKTAKFEVLPETAETTEITADKLQIELKKDILTYTGKALKPGVKSVSLVTLSGNVALKASDYKVVYSGNIDIGTGRVTIVGKKNYVGTGYTTFRIDPKPVSSVTVSGLKNQPYTGKTLSENDLSIVVKAGGIILTKGVDYRVKSLTGDLTNVTTSEVKKAGNAPALEIELVDDDATKKSSTRPKVVWKNSAKKPVKKTFSIIQTKLNSSTVTVTAKHNTESQNKVTIDGNVVGTLRAASKQELSQNKKAYAFVITGSAPTLSKNALLSEAVQIKSQGSNINPADYTMTVSAAKDGKLGTIKFNAVKGKDKGYAGSRTVKFLYLQQKPEED